MAASTQLTPEELSLRASAAVHTAHAKHGSTAMLAKANQAKEALLKQQVDPDGTLPPDELDRRIKHARKAHMTRLSFLAAKARRLKAQERKDETAAVRAGQR